MLNVDLVDAMSSDVRISALAAEDWDDELVARTIDEVVADMLPPLTASDSLYKPSNAVPPPPTASDSVYKPSNAVPLRPGAEDEDDDEEIEEELSPDATAAAKRLRHREAMQRCRERKRSRLGALEKQQRHLKAKLSERLLKLRLRDEPLDARGETPSLSGASLETRRKLFADAVRLKEELLDESHGLRHALLELQKYEKIVASATNQIVNAPTVPPELRGPYVPMEIEQSDNSIEDDASTSDSMDASNPSTRTGGGRPTGHWVQFLDHENPLYYEPEPEESAAKLTRECFLEVRRLQHGFETPTAGLNIHDTFCLGWHAQHAVVRTPQDRLELRFRFQRRVPLSRMSLSDIQSTTWHVMKDPVQNARLYSSLVVCKIVQFVDPNTYIFVRNRPDPDKRLHVRYFSMHSQIEYQTDDGERATVTLMQVLDKDPHEVETPAGKTSTPVVWLKAGTLFLGFTEKLGSQEIEIEYGGSTACMSDQHAAYLLTEVGGALMRWEQMVVPQRLLL